MVLEPDREKAGRTLWTWVSESWQSLKETVGEYLIIAIGAWRKSDSGYKVAGILAIPLPVAM